MSNRLPSVIWLLSFGLFFVGAGQSVVFLTIPPLGRDLGLSEQQIGAIFGISALAWMIASPLWGSLSDTVGRKKIVIVGLIGCGLSLILFSTVISFGISGLLSGTFLFLLLVLARLLNGLFGSATRPASGGWIADITSLDDRGRAFGRLNSGFSAGRIGGPALAGFLLIISYTAPFYIFSAGLILISILILNQPINESQNKLNPTKKSDSSLSILDNSVWPFLFVAITLGVTNASLIITISFYFEDVIIKDSENALTYASIGFMLSAIGSLIGQLFFADKLSISAGSLTRYGSFITLVSLLGIANTQSLETVYIYFFLYGLGMGALQTGLSAALSLSVGPENQGKANGYMGMVFPSGHVVSPFIAMPLYLIDPSAPYLLGASLMLISLIFINLNSRHKWIRKKKYKAKDLNLNEE